MKICVGKITQPARNMAQYRGACQQGGMLLLVPTQQGPRGRKMVGVRVSQSERQTEREKEKEREREREGREREKEREFKFPEHF